MKQRFSNKWIGSKQPRKQRKYRANAPLHIRRKMTSVHLSDILRKKYGKRNFPVIKGDNVKILRGGFKGKTGKVELVNLSKLKIRVENIYRTKKDGTKVSVWFDPSNLMIKELNLDDKMRKKALERKVEKTDNKKEGKDISKLKQDKRSKFSSERKSSQSSGNLPDNKKGMRSSLAKPAVEQNKDKIKFKKLPREGKQ